MHACTHQPISLSHMFQGFFSGYQAAFTQCTVTRVANAARLRASPGNIPQGGRAPAFWRKPLIYFCKVGAGSGRSTGGGTGGFVALGVTASGGGASVDSSMGAGGRGCAGGKWR